MSANKVLKRYKPLQSDLGSTQIVYTCLNLIFCLFFNFFFFNFFQNFTPTPSVKRTMKRCGNTGTFPENCYLIEGGSVFNNNFSLLQKQSLVVIAIQACCLLQSIVFIFLPENDTFIVWEMFPGKDAPLSDSEEEKDFYFSDND